MLSAYKALDSLKAGIFDDILSHTYGSAGIIRAGTRISRVIRGFCERFSSGYDTEISVFSAPGRTELGGNHTDHQNGRVLCAAVDLDILACAAHNGLQLIRIITDGFESINVSLNELEPKESEKNTAAALVRGVAAQLTEKGYKIGGFDAYVISDIPVGSGLSSSAAFEILIGVILNSFFCGGNLQPLELAKIGQSSENVYFGKPCGLMDQLSSALGGIISIDFMDTDYPRIEKIDYDLSDSGYALCAIYTGAGHEELTVHYAAIPLEMSNIASYFGKTHLGQVSMSEFVAAIPELRENCGDRAVLRAFHFFRESMRVGRETDALKNGDIDCFLQLVSESGRSSFMYLQNISTYEESHHQPVAVALAAAEHFLNGSGAYRVHGGGFAGTIQAFVPKSRLDEFIITMDSIFGKDACRILKPRLPGAGLLI